MQHSWSVPTYHALAWPCSPEVQAGDPLCLVLLLQATRCSMKTKVKRIDTQIRKTGPFRTHTKAEHFPDHANAETEDYLDVKHYKHYWEPMLTKFTPVPFEQIGVQVLSWDPMCLLRSEATRLVSAMALSHCFAVQEESFILMCLKPSPYTLPSMASLNGDAAWRRQRLAAKTVITAVTVRGIARHHP